MYLWHCLWASAADFPNGENLNNYGTVEKFELLSQVCFIIEEKTFLVKDKTTKIEYAYPSLAGFCVLERDYVIFVVDGKTYMLFHT